MSRKIRVMVIDDDAVLRKLVSDQVARMGFDSTPAASGEEALDALAKSDFDVLLLDIRMPGLSGLDTLREVRKLEDAPEVIMLTADTSLGTGIEAMRLGAYDYLTKPSTLDEIEAVVRKADEKRRLVRQNASLRDAVRQPSEDVAGAFVYKSGEMEGLVALAETAARADSTVIITGESGTGKDVLARFIHARSSRAHASDVRVIAATNRNLAEDVTAGRFRADLFYRLNVISLHVPPLRRRREDIPALVEHFLALYRERFNRPALDLSAEARARLESYDWPGNVRELRNTLERAAALAAA